VDAKRPPRATASTAALARIACRRFFDGQRRALGHPAGEEKPTVDSYKLTVSEHPPGAGTPPRVSRSCVSGIGRSSSTPAESPKTGSGYPPPPAFCKKRLQVVENKERECEKERKELQRGGKLLRTLGLPAQPGRGRQRHGDTEVRARHEKWKGLQYTPVATGSMRNLLKMGGILTLRGASRKSIRDA